MQQPSRRAILLSTGSLLTLGTAGCVGGSDADDEQSNREPASLPSGLEATLEYVYAPTDDGVMFRIVNVTNDSDPPPHREPAVLSDLGTADWIVYDTDVQSDDGGLVATGSFDDAGTLERYSADGSRGEFDLYRLEQNDEEQQLATDGDTVLLGTPTWVSATLDKHDSEEPTYVTATAGVRSLLAVVDYTGMATLVDDESKIKEPFQDADIDVDRYPERLIAHHAQTEEQVSYTLAGWYQSTPNEAAAGSLESFLAENIDMDDVSTEIKPERNLAIARASRPYTPPEERPETAGEPRFHEYDEESETVRLRFDQGEQLPAEHYELEIDNEVYEGDWTRGQETIGEGSIIAIDADVLEPGDDIVIRYDDPDGASSAMGTAVLRRLPFAVDFDPNERTGELQYLDGPPLDADRLTLTIYGDGEEETRDVWSGRLTSGDAATLSDLPIEGHVVVEYERDDGNRVHVGAVRFGPPGRFDFDYDGPAETLTIRRPDLDANGEPEERYRNGRPRDQEPLSADQYRIVIDGDPAARQWTDTTRTIEAGDTLTVENVTIGSDVKIAWLGESGERHVVAQTILTPDVEFAFSYDASAEELTIQHVGGQAVDPARLSVTIHAPDDRTLDWGSGESVTEGDEFVVENVHRDAHVVVSYDEVHLADTAVSALRDDE